MSFAPVPSRGSVTSSASHTATATVRLAARGRRRAWACHNARKRSRHSRATSSDETIRPTKRVAHPAERRRHVPAEVGDRDEPDHPPHLVVQVLPPGPPRGVGEGRQQHPEIAVHAEELEQRLARGRRAEHERRALRGLAEQRPVLGQAPRAQPRQDGELPQSEDAGADRSRHEEHVLGQGPVIGQVQDPGAEQRRRERQEVDVLGRRGEPEQDAGGDQPPHRRAWPRRRTRCRGQWPGRTRPGLRPAPRGRTRSPTARAPTAAAPPRPARRPGRRAACPAGRRQR